MILRFPNLDTLKLAITSGLIPEKVWSSQAESAFEEEGSVLIKSAGKLPRGSGADLKKLGVSALKIFPKTSLKLACWLQAFPLDREGRQSEDWSGKQSGELNGSSQLTEQSAVLFHLPGEESLVDLVSEMLRLGNDRQSFRYLEMKGKQPFANRVATPDKQSSFLRVIGPPYYSMLRALDEGQIQNGEANKNEPGLGENVNRITAFVEAGPRVWIQYGYRHPLGVQVKPPPGKWLFVQPNHSWLFIDEAPFRDIYQALDIGIPEVKTDWGDVPLEKKIPVSLSLASGSADDPAEMWVIRKNGFAEVERLLRESGDDIVKRLSFAVCETKGEEPCVIIRVRPSRRKPPVLVINGLSLSSYLGIPNLFLPIGTRVHPPLRRDAITNLLTSDGQEIVWLEQKNEEESQKYVKTSFFPHSVSDSAFRPLSDWMEYVLDHEHEALESWVASYNFEFESFVCDEDKKNKPKKKGPSKVDLKTQKGEISEFETGGESKAELVKENKAHDDVDFSTTEITIEQREPDELQVELNSIEAQFLDFQGALDDRARLPLWRAMGELNGKLEHRHDATVCWSNAVWNVDDTRALSADYSGWLNSELQSSRFKKFSARNLDSFCKDKSTRPLDSSLVVAYLVWAADQKSMPKGLGERLNEVAQFVERQEQYLPIRTSWLAWKALYRLSGDDTLMLARARDRVLQRLFDQGLPAEYDMPSFLRARGVGQSERFRLILNHVLELQDLATDWIEEPVADSDPKTKIYAQMMFAFAFAKLGEVTEAKAAVVGAIEELTAGDPIHNWLGNAFEYRVTQALNNQSSQDRLSQELLDRLETMERMSSYKINRLRGISRILEPHERIDAYTLWHKRHKDELAKNLVKLSGMQDLEKIRAVVSDMLKKYKQNHKNYGRVLSVAVELSPRLGENYANHLFDEVVDWLNDKKASTMEKALLLQKSMYVAAHFGRVDVVQSYVSLFEKSLGAIVSEYLALHSNHNTDNKAKVDSIESLFTESFRGLRKLGMREEIGRLYSGVEALVEKHEPKGKKLRQAKNSKTDIDTSRPLRLLLCVAAGWYYFGQEKQAGAIAKQVRKILLGQELPGLEQKDLACAYVNCVSHAPVDDAIVMIKELFQRKKTKRSLANIKDNMHTGSHFSIFQLTLIETTVMALVSDEFSLNDESRRWLDEDEFLVRNRIHEDVRQAMK